MTLRRPSLRCFSLLAFAGLSTVAAAGPDDFHAGALIKEYGVIAEVPGLAPLPADTHFKLAMWSKAVKRAR